uniref:Uncharacterized protein n=1 Tax=Arundo donax TaxID=35708 RepID=A0A0A9EI25_ARUDO
MWKTIVSVAVWNLRCNSGNDG